MDVSCVDVRTLEVSQDLIAPYTVLLPDEPDGRNARGGNMERGTY